LNDAASPNPLASPDSTTLYTLQIKDSIDFCQIERSVAVRVAAPIDSLIASAERDSIFGRDTVRLQATFDSTFLYEWQPANSLSASNIHNPLASPATTTTYEVLVRNVDGCAATAFVTVNVVNLLCELPFVFLPNAFTPNGDGVNDTFHVRGNNIDEVYLAVFNRWGQRVFQSRSLAEPWDGTFRGEQLPPDVYGVYVLVTCFDGSTFQREGNLTLIR